MPPKKKYYLLEVRKNSFKSASLKGQKGRPRKVKWPHDEPSDYSLAESGFYFTPDYKVSTGDSVTCYMCGCVIDGWEPSDDPIEVHYEQNSQCSKAILSKNPWKHVNSNGDVTFDLSHDPHSDNSILTRLETFFHPLSEKEKRQVLVTSTTSNTSIIDAFLNTATSLWPHDAKKGWTPTSINLAKAGFYFAPCFDKDESVCCQYCDWSLENWDPEDNPISEHKKRSPHCYMFTCPTYEQRKLDFEKVDDSASEHSSSMESREYSSASDMEVSSTGRKLRARRAANKRLPADSFDSDTEEKPKRKTSRKRRSSSVSDVEYEEPTKPKKRGRGKKDQNVTEATIPRTLSLKKVRLSSLESEDDNLFAGASLPDLVPSSANRKSILRKEKKQLTTDDSDLEMSDALQPAFKLENPINKLNTKSHEFLSKRSSYDPMASSSGVRIGQVGSVSARISKFEELVPSSPSGSANTTATTPKSPGSIGRTPLSPRFSSPAKKYSYVAATTARLNNLKREGSGSSRLSQTALDIALDRSQSLKDSFDKAKSASSALFNTRASSVHGDSSKGRSPQTPEQRAVSTETRVFTPLPSIPSVPNNLTDILSSADSHSNAVRTPKQSHTQELAHTPDSHPIEIDDSLHERPKDFSKPSVDFNPVSPLVASDILEAGLKNPGSSEKFKHTGKHRKSLEALDSIHKVTKALSPVESSTVSAELPKNGLSVFGSLTPKSRFSKSPAKKPTLSPSQIYHDPENHPGDKANKPEVAKGLNDSVIIDERMSSAIQHLADDNSVIIESVVMSDDENLPLPPRIRHDENWTRLSSGSSGSRNSTESSTGGHPQPLLPSSPSQTNVAATGNGSSSPTPTSAAKKKTQHGVAVMENNTSNTVATKLSFDQELENDVANVRAATTESRPPVSKEPSPNTLHSSPALTPLSSSPTEISKLKKKKKRSVSGSPQKKALRHLNNIEMTSSLVDKLTDDDLVMEDVDNYADNEKDEEDIVTNTKVSLFPNVISQQVVEDEMSLDSVDQHRVQPLKTSPDVSRTATAGSVSTAALSPQRGSPGRAFSSLTNRSAPSEAINGHSPLRHLTLKPSSTPPSVSSAIGSPQPSSTRAKHHIAKHPHFSVSGSSTILPKNSAWVPADLDAVFEVLQELESEDVFGTANSSRSVDDWVQDHDLLDKTLTEVFQYMSELAYNTMMDKSRTLIENFEQEAKRAEEVLRALPVLETSVDNGV